jgi:hypothetical protein
MPNEAQGLILFSREIFFTAEHMESNSLEAFTALPEVTIPIWDILFSADLEAARSISSSDIRGYFFITAFELLDCAQKEQSSEHPPHLALIIEHALILFPNFSLRFSDAFLKKS